MNWLLQGAALLLILGIAVLAPQAGRPLFRRLQRAFDRLARRPRLAVCLVGLFTFATHAALGLLVHLPVPAVHDEFAYLLAADTFAKGRLTNPTHPHWEHFESYHVIHQPTYQAKYPPGQGLVLAAGQVVFGHPIAGVWLSFAVACAAVCWMLQAWVPSRWALLGGLLCALHPGMADWAASYWGGAVAMSGGALLFGALRRIVTRPRVKDALLLGIGVALLANSRPYEGLVVSVPAASALLGWMLADKAACGWLLARRLILPVLAVLVPAGVWMSYYNWRVTGDPLTMPYQVWKQTYTTSPSLAGTMFSPLKSVDRQEPRRRIPQSQTYDAAPEKAESRLSVRTASKLRHLWMFYFRPTVFLAWPLVALPWLLRARWTGFAVMTCLLLWILVALESTSPHPHYTAPVTCLLILTAIQGFRFLRTWKWDGAPNGRFLVPASLVVAATMLATQLVSLRISQPVHPLRRWSLHRAAIQQRLRADGRKHLIFVRYSPEHIWHFEWVYNRADIDAAEVVWAHDLGPAENRDLVRYFPDRQAWLLEADADPPELRPRTNSALANSSGVSQRRPEPSAARPGGTPRSYPDIPE